MDDRGEAFAWFDSLELKAVRLEKFGVVRTWSYDREGRRRDSVPMYGFLVDSSDPTFTFMSMNLGQMKYMRPAPGVQGARSEWSKESLAKWAQGQVDLLKVAATTGAWPQDYNLRPGFMGVFIAARLLEKSDPALSDKCFDFILHWPSQGQGSGAPKSALTMVQGAFDWNYSATVTGISSSDPPSRDEDVRHLRWYLAHFPNGESRALAEKLIPVMEQMAKEDKAHASATWASLNQKQKIDELVFRLRDERYSYPGQAEDLMGKDFPKSPSAALASIGYPAVPALIEAVGDSRPSRAMPSSWSGPHVIRPLTIGDVALQVLRTISCRSFYTGGTLPEERLANSKKLAEEWWAEASKKGERQMLVEELQQGNGQAGWRLAERFPGETDGVLYAAWDKGSPEVRRGLVSLMGRIDSDHARSLIRDLMKSAPDLETRWGATQTVARFDMDAAVAQTVADMPTLLTSKNGEYGRVERLEFLASSGRVAGIRGVAANLPKLTTWQRQQVLQSFASGTVPPRWQGQDVARGISEPGYAEEFEKLLVSELNDTERQIGSSGGNMDFRYHDGRVADFATYALTKSWPKKYVQPNFYSPFEREDARIQNLNIWAKEHGGNLLPRPTRPHIDPISDDVLKPLLSNVAVARTPARVEAAYEAVEKLGLGTLPALRRDPSLAPLAVRVSDIVREVRVLGDVPAAYKPFADAVLALKGSRLTSDGLCEAIQKGVAVASGGFNLSAVRDLDGGISIALTFGPGSPYNAFECTQSVYVHGEGIGGTGSSGSGNDYLLKPENWAAFRAAVEKALHADLDKVVEIEARVVFGK